MNRQSLFALAIATFSISSCSVGGWGSGYRESAFGTSVEVRYPGITIRDGREFRSEEQTEGELLLIQDDALIVLISDRATLVRLDAINSLTFPDSPVDRWPDADLSPEEHREQMRLVSRYPYGLTDEQLATVLASLGQSDLDPLQ